MQRGVSLLEVLIAIVAFSIGILGLALMQLKGASFTKQAGSRSSVNMATRGLIDAMRELMTALVLGLIVVAA